MNAAFANNSMDFSSPPKGLPGWLICAAFAMWIALLSINLAKKIRGPEGHPPNEKLGADSSALAQRVEKIEKSISELWTTMRSENTRIEKEITDFATAIERAVGRLEGSMKNAARRNDTE